MPRLSKFLVVAKKHQAGGKKNQQPQQKNKEKKYFKNKTKPTHPKLNGFGFVVGGPLRSLLGHYQVFLLTEPKPGSGLRFCDSRAAAPRSFNNPTVASDRESQIASLTPVSI